MGTLKDLINLEKILQKYNELNFDHHLILSHYGDCVEEFVDGINRKLTSLLVSDTKLSCRNVLIANFETMTRLEHWLECKIFNDLSKEKSRRLQAKMEGMVELLKELVLKVMTVDGEYADSFFKRLKEKYQKNNVYEFDIWKTQVHELTMDLLAEFQTQLTAKMLKMGILKYDRKPSLKEIAGVDVNKLREQLKHGEVIDDDFIEECAKLRRYCYWKEDMFIVKYDAIRVYLFKVFGKLTKAQRLALFNYDVQMEMVHEEMVKLKPELRKYLGEREDTREFGFVKSMTVLMQSDVFKSFFTNDRYNNEWIEMFVSSLVKSEHRDMILDTWQNSDKRSTLKGIIVGCLRNAGVIEGSKLGIATELIKGLLKDNKKFAIYMGYSKKTENKAINNWICDYVNH